MRSVQRGISTSFLVVAVLTIAIAVTAGYFVFYIDAKKIKSINSFEDCAKLYPVMESYPEQCNTPDGKHFIKELFEKEKSVLPSPVPPESIDVKIIDWKTYKNSEYKFSINYPSNWQVVTEKDDPTKGAYPVNFYSPEVDLNIPDPGVPIIGVTTDTTERPLGYPPKDFSENGIDFITDTHEIMVDGRKGYQYQTHQCAPQCVTNTIVLVGKTELLSIFMTTVAKERGYNPIYDEMVKSFRILK